SWLGGSHRSVARCVRGLRLRSTTQREAGIHDRLRAAIQSGVRHGRSRRVRSDDDRRDPAPPGECGCHSRRESAGHPHVNRCAQVTREASVAVTCPIGFDVATLRSEVQTMYARVATAPDGEFHFHRGPEYAATMLGYDATELASLPSEVTSSFAGIGNP